MFDGALGSRHQTQLDGAMSSPVPVALPMSASHIVRSVGPAAGQRDDVVDCRRPVVEHPVSLRVRHASRHHALASVAEVATVAVALEDVLVAVWLLGCSQARLSASMAASITRSQRALIATQSDVSHLVAVTHRGSQHQ